MNFLHRHKSNVSWISVKQKSKFSVSRQIARWVCLRCTGNTRVCVCMCVFPWGSRRRKLVRRQLQSRIKRHVPTRHLYVTSLQDAVTSRLYQTPFFIDSPSRRKLPPLLSKDTKLKHHLSDSAMDYTSWHKLVLWVIKKENRLHFWRVHLGECNLRKSDTKTRAAFVVGGVCGYFCF